MSDGMTDNPANPPEKDEVKLGLGEYIIMALVLAVMFGFFLLIPPVLHWIGDFYRDVKVEQCKSIHEQRLLDYECEKSDDCSFSRTELQAKKARDQKWEECLDM